LSKSKRNLNQWRLREKRRGTHDLYIALFLASVVIIIYLVLIIVFFFYGLVIIVVTKDRKDDIYLSQFTFKIH
jgi:hypothetical protein